MGFSSRFLQASSGSGGDGTPSPGSLRGTAFMANQGILSGGQTDYAGNNVDGHYKYFWPAASDSGTTLTNSDRGTYFWFKDSSDEIRVYYEGTIGSNYVFITVSPASGPAFATVSLYDEA